MAKVHTQGGSQASAETGMAGPGCLVLEANFLGRESYSVKAEERWGNIGMDQGFPKQSSLSSFVPVFGFLAVLISHVSSTRKQSFQS